MTLRTAFKASQENGAPPPKYTGHAISEDFGESEKPANTSAPASKTPTSRNRSTARTKQAVVRGSQAEQSAGNNNRKRKASADLGDDDEASKGKRARSTRATAPPARRAKGTSCDTCRKRRMKCTHPTPTALAAAGSQEAGDSSTIATGHAAQGSAASERSRKPAARRGKRVIAGQEELPDATAEVVSSSTPSVANVLGQPTESPSTPSTDDAPTYVTPPSSISTIGHTSDEKSAHALPESQEASHVNGHARSSSTTSSVLSSAPSNIGDIVTQDAFRESDHGEAAGSSSTESHGIVNEDEATEKSPVLTTKEKRAASSKERSKRRQSSGEAARNAVTEGEDKDGESSLIAQQKRAERTRKGWETRRKNAREAAEAAKTAATQVEVEDEDRYENEDEAPATKEKRPVSVRKGSSKRKQNTAETADAAPKKAIKREAPVRKVSSSKQTKLVTLPVPKSAPSSASKPRSTRKKQPLSTPLPKAGLNENGLLTTTSSQPDDPPPEPTLDVDDALVHLAEKLARREPLASKPLPQGQPLVWADSRQALCETVPYFKMPQSGCHQNDRHVYAFLFDSIGHCREYMDSNVIIARAGGGMEADASGQMVQKKDHLMRESQVQSVLNDIALQNPLVLICSDRNVGPVCKMPHKYNVLGWYKPVSVWAEKTLGKGGKKWTTIKYRFERLDDSKPAWHQPLEHLITDEDRQLAGDLAHTVRPCSDCDQTFAQVYLCGWMCLNPDCDQFWKLESGEDAPYGKLLYNPAFLLDRTRWAKEEEPYGVKPAVPTVGNTVGDNLTYINTRGICCPQCGRCSSRRLFKGWRCDNPSCMFESFPQHIPVTPPMLHSPWENSGDGPALARNKHEGSQGVNVAVTHVHGFKVYTYTFEGVNGRFVHAVSNAKINRQPRGPDEMFAAIQRQDEPDMDMHLERRRFGIEKMPVNKVEAQAEQPVTATPGTPSPQKSSQVDLEPDTLIALGLMLSPVSPDQAADDMRTRHSSKLSGSHGNFESSTLTNKDTSSDRDEPAVGPSASIEDSSISNESDPLPNATAVPTQGTERTFLAGIEEAAKVVEPQSDSSKDTTIIDKPAVEDGDLMTAFSINYGMPYKFIAVGGSLPFTDSPWPVRTCRADLNWASQTFLDPTDHMEFNEELIFAYLQGQKIEYHDDGESGLGPRIATLSLGGKAKMHMRMKMKHYTGCSKTGILTAEKPMPHSIDGPEMYQKRLAAWNEVQALKTTDKAEYERRRKEIPKELGLFTKRMKKAEDLVTVTLNHGDIVLMEGYEIQQYLEHKVVPEHCLRFALTCRTVLPDHLKPEERPAYEVEPDDESMSCLRAMVARENES